ncbi:4-aminobutyrate aminotransferase [Candidatus Hydrogenisulfobacillus filiaventi]|uniref:(S)-3-amino-2-methylpropionate transaminase n=1 Tax=Candidatus Hydrogenisulfobacillus filiaventi TaxID=2707344 RepID=A0A6F8ZGL9_9FIRM|nr:4-aminobutyrate--2-oxoglutarate transaminase [Bacillota bacterium]CAB1128898.1 4-aminobutyrate aminotransferase [Candidatus Hydrogenisulfobacillus filiaventi]
MASPAFIRLRTPLPGPNSRAILARMEAAVPRAVRPGPTVVVARAHGSLLEDVDGNTLIDFTGGVGVLNVGHTPETVVAAIRAQAERYLHTDFTVVPYEGYVRLAERVGARFPGPGPVRAAFFNSGAEAVENAVKVARIYTGRSAVVAFTGAFHGRTWMALSLTSKTRPYKQGLGPFVPEVYRLPFPYPYRCPWAAAPDPARYRRLEEALALQVDPGDVAAVVVEPVQGEGGIVVPPPDFLPWLRDFTRRHGICLIVDEVQTGFGRTGTFFAVEQAGISPDLLVTAKSLAAGLPLSAVLGPAAVMDAPLPGQLGGTFVGNPVAVAAALAVLDRFEQEPLLEAARDQGRRLRDGLEDLARQDPGIGEVRGLGAMQAIELVRDRTSREPDPARTAAVVTAARDRGLLLLPAGIYNNVIRFLAPLTTPPAVLEEGMAVLGEALAATRA